MTSGQNRVDQSINHKFTIVAKQWLMLCTPPNEKRKNTRSFERARMSFGAALNLVAGLLHVLAEAMGRVAAETDDGQESGDE
jgi:hypothetical protein